MKIPICISTQSGLILADIDKNELNRTSIIPATLNDKEKEHIAAIFSQKYREKISADAITLDYSRLHTVDIEIL